MLSCAEPFLPVSLSQSARTLAESTCAGAADYPPQPTVTAALKALRCIFAGAW